MTRANRWRIIVVFPLVLVGACVMLLLDVVRATLAEIHGAMFAALVAVIEWGSSDSGSGAEREDPERSEGAEAVGPQSGDGESRRIAQPPPPSNPKGNHP